MVESRQGASRLGCLIWLLIGVILIYLGMHFGEPWFKYQQYRDEMKTTVSFGAALSDAEIRRRIQVRADSLELPVEARTVIITRSRDSLKVSSRYQVVVRLLWYGPVTLNFAPHFEAPL